MIATDPFWAVILAISIIPGALLLCAGVERMWHEMSYLAYLWRHRKYLRF